MDAVESGRDFIRRSMFFSCRVCASTALNRAEALPAGLFEPADYPAIDFGLRLRMALEWDMAFLTDSLAEYRFHGEGTRRLRASASRWRTAMSRASC